MAWQNSRERSWFELRNASRERLIKYREFKDLAAKYWCRCANHQFSVKYAFILVSHMRSFTCSPTSTRKVSARLNYMLTAFTLLAIFSNTVFAQHRNIEKTKSKPQIILAAGDIADCRKLAPELTKSEKTAELIETVLAQDNKALVLSLGDNTYPIGKASEFNECYEKTWGRFKQRTLPSPGNHEYGIPLAQGYYHYFDELAGPDRRGYYKKTFGNWLLLSLNSNIRGQAMQEQLTWLRKELQENKSTCTLAFWHHPVFSSGGHGNNEVMKKIWELLASHKADIVLASHDHNYERFTPLDARGFRDDRNGIRSFVVGTGGATLTPMFLPKSTTEIRDNDAHGILKLQLYSTGYEWEFIPIAGQTFKDQGQALCHR